MNLKSQAFLTHNDLTAFANAHATAITAIVFDATSGMFVLFYTA